MKKFFVIIGAILSGAIGLAAFLPSAVEAGHMLN
jgi:hypothetical protein